MLALMPLEPFIFLVTASKMVLALGSFWALTVNAAKMPNKQMISDFLIPNTNKNLKAAKVRPKFDKKDKNSLIKRA